MKGERRAPEAANGRRRPGRTLALVLAILVHVAFLGVLVWSVRWQSRPPAPVTAELYAPPAKPKAPEPEAMAVPPRTETPRSETKPEPPPPPPPPPPKADAREAELALKAKEQEERKAREKAEAERREREKAEAERRERERKAAEEKRLADEKRKADERRAAEARERQQRATEAIRAEAEREASERAQAEARARAKAQADAAAAAAQADWIRRIQAKIRGNVILPPDLPGNPEAVFEVVQLPTGEILDARLARSSGVKAYDDAVARAIVKSSPLPRPERAEQFSRTLTLRFRPLD